MSPTDPSFNLAASYEEATATIEDPPLRVQILKDAAVLTDGDRNVEYGDPTINMACAGELKDVVSKYLARAMSPAEREAIDMALSKIARLVTGHPKRDTYVDGACYLAIAGECAIRSEQSRP